MPFVFDIVLILNELQMQGGFILHAIHISGTSMIEEAVYGLYISNNLVGMMQGLNTFQFNRYAEAGCKDQWGCNHNLGPG